jgi:hypothetical protein
MLVIGNGSLNRNRPTAEEWQSWRLENDGQQAAEGPMSASLPACDGSAFQVLAGGDQRRWHIQVVQAPQANLP